MICAAVSAACPRRLLVRVLPLLLTAAPRCLATPSPPSRCSSNVVAGISRGTQAICSSSMAASEGGSYSYRYPRPSLTVDAIIVSEGEGGGTAKLLLIQRKHDPFAGSWALPGGFVDENEPLDTAAARELQEETSVDPSHVLLTQVGAFGDPGRDPRGWCVSVAYAALVPSTELGVKAADDAQAAQWYPVDDLPKLAFDHKLIVRTAFRHLASQEAVRQQAGLAGQLRAAADRLEGPWQQQ